MSSFLVASRFSLRKRVGGGSFGEIYSGENIETHQQVAVKLEPANTKNPQLDVESKIYRFLEGGNGIPHCYFYGTEGKYNVMVIDYLSSSLEDLLVKRKSFSVKTVMMLADQMLACVEFMHRKHFIHRDIKPDNFMMGVGKKSNQVYIIDFGLSRRFEDPKTLKHINYSDKRSMTGTARYASISAMRGIEQSRRDDMESLAYVWVYLLKGKLPWQGLPAKTQKEKMEKIASTKANTNLDNLCRGFPKFFINYIEKVRNLKFDEEPDYKEYRKMLRDAFIDEGMVFDYVYDWSTERKPAMTQPVSAKMSPRQQIDVPKRINHPNSPKNVNSASMTNNNMNNANIGITNIVSNNIVNHNLCANLNSVNNLTSYNQNVIHANHSSNIRGINNINASTNAKLRTNPNMKRVVTASTNLALKIEKINYVRTAVASPRGRKRAASRAVKPKVFSPIRNQTVFPMIEQK
ncbi:CK1 family protein kinase [Tritrichomonas foetus]|uniref:non-specific serine/threonine protein kinase n=1 Tax=Tritrichomonas foetus TaxID=1144522 RepID=A0A1J4JG75_9EUKA|nr:CK1 family protein kinase [Tritrichomonas foetus]|eukprot:OHS97311.1 CK1 family protein kinase [Tritrichomonas foetus]